MNELGESTGAETLWIPYALVAGFVLILAVIFAFTKLPDVKSADEVVVDESVDARATTPDAHKGVALFLLWLNITVLAVAVGMIVSAVVAIPSFGRKLGMTDGQALIYTAGALIVIGTALFFLKKGKIANTSIWLHPHFSGSTIAQFLYVAAQSGIFAYFINYMTSQLPPVPGSWKDGAFAKWLEVQANGTMGLSDAGASNLFC